MFVSLIESFLRSLKSARKGIFLDLGPTCDVVMDTLECDRFHIQTDYLPIISWFSSTDDRFALWNQFPPLVFTL